MTARFVPPAPNCGHLDGVTFTFVPIAQTWMCTLCMASLGALYQTCACCGSLPPRGTQLISTTRGSLCIACRREVRVDARFDALDRKD